LTSNNDVLKAVEILCEILGEILETPGMGAPQTILFIHRLNRLKGGCVALRRGDPENALARCIINHDSEGGKL
jgi:hypothetical protein